MIITPIMILKLIEKRTTQLKLEKKRNVSERMKKRDRKQKQNLLRIFF